MTTVVSAVGCMPLLGAASVKPNRVRLLLLMRDRISGDENRFLPQIRKQESLKPRTILQDFVSLRSLVPIHGKITINHAHTIIYDLARLRKIIPSGTFNNRA